MAFFKCMTSSQNNVSNTLYSESRSWNKSTPITWTAPRDGTIKVTLFESGYASSTNMRTITFTLFGHQVMTQSYSGDVKVGDCLQKVDVIETEVTKGTTYTSSYTETSATMTLYGAVWTYVD